MTYFKKSLTKNFAMLCNELDFPLARKRFLFTFFCFPASLIYYLLSRLHYIFYKIGFFKTRSLRGLTLSLGNISVGGTGKSPLVLEFARALKHAGHEPVILSRGYLSGLKKKSFLVYQDGKVLYSHKIKNLSKIRADEALMQSSCLPKVPVIIGALRYQAAQFYCEKSGKNPSHWILDDAYQHYKIKKDYNIVLLDAKVPFSNGYILPLGGLRTPVSDLKRADLIIYTRSSKKHPKAEHKSLVSQVTRAPSFSIPFESQWPVEANSYFSKQASPLAKDHPPVSVVLGIAKPEQFVQALKKMGVRILKVISFGDHKYFSASTLKASLDKDSILLTSLKDYFRCQDILKQVPGKLYLVDLKLKISEKEILSLIEKKKNFCNTNDIK